MAIEILQTKTDSVDATARVLKLARAKHAAGATHGCGFDVVGLFVGIASS